MTIYTLDDLRCLTKGLDGDKKVVLITGKNRFTIGAKLSNDEVHFKIESDDGDQGDRFINHISNELLKKCYEEINKNEWGAGLEEAYNNSAYKGIMPKSYFINFICMEMARRWVKAL